MFTLTLGTFPAWGGEHEDEASTDTDDLLYTQTALGDQWKEDHVLTASGDLRWVDVDLEGAKRSGEFLLDDDKKIPLFYEPGQKPWITSGEHYAGQHSLGCRVYQDGTDRKDRSEIIVSDYRDRYELKFGRIRYFGLAIYVHPDTNPDSSPVVIQQAVQSGHGNRPVPFVIWMRVIDGVPQIKVEVTDSDNVKHNLSDWVEIAWDGWSEIATLLAPRHKSFPAPKGLVQVKLNGALIASSRLHWGYVPSGKTRDEWRLSTGIYRPTPKWQDGKVVVFLDQVRLASSWELASP